METLGGAPTRRNALAFCVNRPRKSPASRSPRVDGRETRRLGTKYYAVTFPPSPVESVHCADYVSSKLEAIPQHHVGRWLVPKGLDWTGAMNTMDIDTILEYSLISDWFFEAYDGSFRWTILIVTLSFHWSVAAQWVCFVISRPRTYPEFIEIAYLKDDGLQESLDLTSTNLVRAMRLPLPGHRPVWISPRQSREQHGCESSHVYQRAQGKLRVF